MFAIALLLGNFILRKSFNVKEKPQLGIIQCLLTNDLLVKLALSLSLSISICFYLSFHHSDKQCRDGIKIKFQTKQIFQPSSSSSSHAPGTEAVCSFLGKRFFFSLWKLFSISSDAVYCVPLP